MKQLLTVFAAISMLFVACSKDDDFSPLPPMSDPEDVCSAMDDINFMKYCYTFFDVNKNGKVSIAEAEAVREMINFSNDDVYITLSDVSSFKGIEYFKNVEKIYLHVSKDNLSVDFSSLRRLNDLEIFTECSIPKLIINCENMSRLALSQVFGSHIALHIKSKHVLKVNDFECWLTSHNLSIFVPKHLVDDYKVAHNWKEYADYIYGY